MSAPYSEVSATIRERIEVLKHDIASLDAKLDVSKQARDSGIEPTITPEGMIETLNGFNKEFKLAYEILENIDGRLAKFEVNKQRDITAIADNYEATEALTKRVKKLEGLGKKIHSAGT